MVDVQVMDEEDEDDGDDDGGEPLTESDEVEGQRGVLGGLLGDAPASSHGLQHGELTAVNE